MDPMLFKAAKDGDVQALLRSLHDDPLILERAATMTADTPLHVAAMFGHLEFVKELIKNMSNNVVDHVKELNQHGFSALHLASSKGHVEVVKELFKVVTVGDHQDLCSLKGRDGLTPLHCASIQGRVEIILQLLSTSPGCVSEVNEAGETALHLAVKNYQLGALTTLLDVVKQHNMLEILNSKDMGGNTVFHVAAARKNSQAIELLLKCSKQTPGIAINAANEKGLTALDLLLLCPCETGHVSEAAELLLRHAGEEIARVPTPPAQANSGENEILVLPTNNQSSPKKKTEEIPDIDEPWEDYFKFQYGKEKPKDVRNSQLVVAVLMATATYTAGLTPPGGLNQEGKSIVASNAPFSFILFIVFNSVGFFISINTIAILTKNIPLFLELYLAMLGLTVTYVSALARAAPPGILRNAIILAGGFLPLSIFFVSYRLRYFYRQHRRGPESRHQHV